MTDGSVAVEFHVEDDPDPLDVEVLESQIRREASAAMGLGDEVDLAIFVRDDVGAVVAAEAEAAARGCSQTVHFTYDSTSGREAAS